MTVRRRKKKKTYCQLQKVRHSIRQYNVNKINSCVDWTAWGGKKKTGPHPLFGAFCAIRAQCVSKQRRKCTVLDIARMPVKAHNTGGPQIANIILQNYITRLIWTVTFNKKIDYHKSSSSCMGLPETLFSRPYDHLEQKWLDVRSLFESRNLVNNKRVEMHVVSAQ